MKSLGASGRVVMTVLALLAGAGSATAQTVVRPGFNIFSVEQDAEIGRQSAIEAEKQVPILNNAALSRYVSSLGAKLAARAPGPRFTYQFKVANLSDVNAFALPGGYVYVNRGLIEKVRNEGELAGVMAHEIAHVALRHPTNQASKAYLANAGLGVLGGLLGARTQTSTGQIIGAVGGFGMNTLFLKFSRSIESQADIVGSQIMARAGYDPIAMAQFFSYLGQQSGSQSRLATFLSDHPAPANREARVRQEAALLGAVHSSGSVGNLASMQTQLRRLPAAGTMTQLAQGGTSTTPAPSSSAIERPSTQYRVFQQANGLYRIDQPDNWSAYVPAGGMGVTIVPRGGVETSANGRQNIVYGVIVNHYVPFDGQVGTSFTDPNGSMFGSSDPEQSASDLVRHILEGNPHLHAVSGTQQLRSVSGQSVFSTQLEGRSPETGVDERVTVVTRQLPDEHIIYLLLIAPARDYPEFQPAFDRMTLSLRTDTAQNHN